jgi:hypothetical protein
MISHDLFDAAINLACVVTGFVVAFRIRWRGKQPSSKLLPTIGAFIIFSLWFVTGVFMHIDFVINVFRPIPYTKTYFFGLIALAWLIYGAYLFAAGKAKASD